MADPRLADRRAARAGAAARVAEDRDEPHQRAGRRNGEQRRDHREHDEQRLLPAQLRLAARALAHLDRHLVHAQAGLAQPQQRLDLWRLGHVRLREHRQRLRVRRVHAAGRVQEGPAEGDPHRAPQERRSEAPRPRRRVAVRREALAAREARADRDVALAVARRARAGARARRPGAGRRRRRGRRGRSRAGARRRSPRRSRPAGRGSGERDHLGAAVCGPRRRSRRSSRRRRRAGRPRGAPAAARRARPGRFSSSFQAGRKTSVLTSLRLVATKAATSRICCALSWPPNDGIPPPPFVDLRDEPSS